MHADPPAPPGREDLWEDLADRHARRRRLRTAAWAAAVVAVAVVTAALPRPGAGGTPPAPAAARALSDAAVFPDDGVRRFAARDADAACARGAEPQLAARLREFGCTALIRAATATTDGVAVTVAAASFAEPAAAARAVAAAPRSGVLPLPPARADVDTLRVSGTAGPYAVFVVAGHADGTPVTPADAAVARAAAEAEAWLRGRLAGLPGDGP